MRSYMIITAPLTQEQTAKLVAVPGVKARTFRGVPGYLVPYNVGWLVEAQLRAWSVAATIKLLGDPAPDRSWEELRSILEGTGEVLPWVYDFTLPYQREDAAWASTRDAALWWVAGAGKTLGSILAALGGGHGPVVTITKAAARGQWASEVRRFTTLRPYVVLPIGQRRKSTPDLATYVQNEQEAGRRPWIIAGWEAVPTLTKELRAVGILSPIVVFDEIHKAKSAKRVTTTIREDGSRKYTDLDNIVSNAAKLAKMAQHRIGTTATPVKDRLRDLWGQLDLIEPGAWGNFYAFTVRYCAARQGTYGLDTSGVSRVEELQARLSFVARKRPFHETHRNLPAKRRQSWYIPVAEQNRGWTQKKITSELKKASARGPSAILEVKLAAAAAAKRDAIVERVIEALENGQKVVVFDGRTENVDALVAALSKGLGKISANNIPARLWAAYGSGAGPHKTTPEAREAVRQAYMDHPGPCVLVGTGDAWGTAYNLHDTDVAIIAMLPWTGGDLHQWEGRFSRQGMKRPVLIIFPIAEHSADTRIAEVLIGKLPAMEQIADDRETADAREAIGGIEDRDKIAAGIVAFLEDLDLSGVEDE
jgi:hypothetical protein